MKVEFFEGLAVKQGGAMADANKKKEEKQEPKIVKEEVKTYTQEDAVAASKEYFEGDELAATVWVSKYAVKDSYGNIYERTPEDMHWRLAKEIGRIEKKYPNPMTAQEIFELLDKFRYIVPQGGPMTGIGNKHQIASLSNCFVIGTNPSADSYGGIFRIDEEQVQLMKRRGGVGHDLSHIRPSGTPVLNSALNSTGIVPFMERYSNSTREVAMDGRRGALMLSVSIKHPDAEKFIDAKMQSGKVTGANVSVKIDDEFMECVRSGKDFVQKYPIDADTPKYSYEVSATNLWKKIIHNAWKSAEPGVLFWDTIIKNSVPDCYADLGFRTVSTNPCGEIPLCPYDSCRLVAINLYSYVENPFTSKAAFNTGLYKEHVHKAMRIMDDVIDLELEKIDAITDKIDADPEPADIKLVERNLWKKIREKAIAGRRTGLGITAEGDMLAALGLRYGTDEAINFSVETQKTLAVEAYRASVAMAKERGAFSIYDAKREENNPMIGRIREADPELYKEMTRHGRRNIAMLTIAPTGTTSLMTQTTSGIEPVFLPYYMRRRKINHNDKNVKVAFVDEVGDAFEEFPVFHHKFETWLGENGYNVEEIKSSSKEFIQAIVEKSPYHKATSNDIDWVAKVKMQGLMQQWVDHSISVTVNLPNDISEEMVARVYQTAWESGCKGITVYRDGSRNGVLVAADDKKKKKKDDEAAAMPAKRPDELEADLIRFKNGSEEWIAFVGLYNGKPYEIFTGVAAEDGLWLPKSVNKGKIVKVNDPVNGKRYDWQYTDSRGILQTVAGISYMFNKEFWNYARFISGVLRAGVPIVDVVSIVDGLHLSDESINTWKNGVERTLKRYITNGTRAKAGQKCPECGSDELIYREGCLTCQSCGHSKCG
ncbi:MAG: adenosylcobalamin-dependent ribonucleoside-diphosphate reductase [Prevotellaceae bacterium]|jgi:ribonucleoside-diphosphate reductase alpha chain|nr:adenosylcobalamin-dependent ribonucleoside-diphosphate reductase [Prevotellaceae bacterium]